MKVHFPASIGICLLALAGCVKGDEVAPGQPVAPPDPPKIETIYQTADSLKPDASPPKQADIILAGTSIAVELQETRKNNELILVWMVDPNTEAGGPVEVEREKYFYSDSIFSFAGTGHEKYDPPINLIRYPLEVGATWDWSGKIISGQTTNLAKAKISTSPDSPNLASGKVNTLLVKVVLEYVNTTSPMARELKFWFKPGEGIIQRDLWDSSTRMLRAPIAPESPPETSE